MEQHRTQTNDDVPQIGDDEDPVMAVAQTVADTHDSKMYEDHIGHGVDEFSAVRRDVVYEWCVNIQSRNNKLWFHRRRRVEGNEERSSGPLIRTVLGSTVSMSGILGSW